MTIEWGITTSKRRKCLSQDAISLAGKLGIPIIVRCNQGVDKLKRQYGLNMLLVEENDELAVYAKDSRLVFHPGMTVPRVKLFTQNKPEVIIEAMALQPGERVLDCTMGLANDALLAAYLVGESGSVTAIESVPAVFATVKYGLKHYRKGSRALRAAMGRITPRLGDYRKILPILADGSFDLVYFDPMFDRPLDKSVGINELRPLADYTPLDQQAVQEALRVCKNKVLIKHRKGSMDHWPFDEVIGGKYSPIAFGVFYRKGE